MMTGGTPILGNHHMLMMFCLFSFRDGRWFPWYSPYGRRSQTLANSFEFWMATSWPERNPQQAVTVFRAETAVKVGSCWWIPFKIDSDGRISHRKSSCCFSKTAPWNMVSHGSQAVVTRQVTWPENGKLHRCIVLNLQVQTKSNKLWDVSWQSSPCFCSQEFSKVSRHALHGPLEQSSQVVSRRRGLTSHLPSAFRRSLVLCSRRCGELLRWCIGCEHISSLGRDRTSWLVGFRRPCQCWCCIAHEDEGLGQGMPEAKDAAGLCRSPGDTWSFTGQPVFNKMKPTNPNAHMNLPDTHDMTLLERHSWETLLGRHSWETLLAWHSWEDTLRRHFLAWHSRKDTPGRYSWEDPLGKTLLGDTLGKTLLTWHSWETLLGDTLGGHSWHDTSIFITCPKMQHLPRNLHVFTSWRSPDNAIRTKVTSPHV